MTAAVEGDLTRRIATEGRSGELLVLTQGINTLIEMTMSVVHRIKEAADEVLVRAEEISGEVAGPQGWTEATVKTLINRLLRKKAIEGRRADIKAKDADREAKVAMGKARKERG